MYISFINFTKAFDTVDRPLLFRILSKVGCPPKLISLIQCLYTNVNARLIFDGKVSKSFAYNDGVKQGCKLAPSLFEIYYPFYSGYLSKTFSTSFPSSYVFELMVATKVFYEYLREAQYADDIAIMSETAYGLQTLLTEYNVTSRKFGLKINAIKTEVMCIGPDFFVDDVKLKIVERFKYLGSYVNRPCRISKQKSHPVFRQHQTPTII